MRCSSIRSLQYALLLVLLLFSIIQLSTDTRNRVNYAVYKSQNVLGDIKRLVVPGKNITSDRKWDPFGIFRDDSDDDNGNKENVVFSVDRDIYKKPQIRNCTRQDNFVFVKVHKAGSTTLISILQRYGHRHNLTFALPKKGDVFLGWPYILEPAKHVLPLENEEMRFNILVNHAIFNNTTMSEIIPNNPKFIGIVRSPLTHLKSSMNYFQKMLIPEDEIGKYSMNERMERFAYNPHYYDGINDRMKNNKDPKFHIHSVTRNFQSADFGLRYDDMNDRTAVDAFLSDMRQNFPFLLVMEYMHESLLLLKRRWCWDLQDILFLQKNVFKYQGKTEPLRKEVADTLLNTWLNIDQELYMQANKTLWSEIAREDNFHMELSYYKSINNLVGSFCKTDIMLFRKQDGRPALQTIKLPPLEIAASYWNEPMTITHEDCKDLMRFEMAFTRLLQIKQRPDLFEEDYYLGTRDGISNNVPDTDNRKKK